MGMAIAMGGMAIGFASGVLNIYTTGIGQSIVGLPIYSGIGFRILALVVFYIITVIYILNYAKKIKADPSTSIVAKDYMERSNEKEEHLMPILGPLGQLVNINQQIMVLVYNYGDGFTKYIWPTSGALMAGLAMCDLE